MGLLDLNKIVVKGKWGIIRSKYSIYDASGNQVGCIKPKGNFLKKIVSRHYGFFDDQNNFLFSVGLGSSLSFLSSLKVLDDKDRLIGKFKRKSANLSKYEIFDSGNRKIGVLSIGEFIYYLNVKISDNKNNVLCTFDTKENGAKNTYFIKVFDGKKLNKEKRKLFLAAVVLIDSIYEQMRSG